MREYETVFVLRPTVEDARVEEEIEGVRQAIQASSGEVLGIERWGRRRLAYQIRKMNEGIYTLIRFRAKPGIVQDLERRYRLREDVLRHLTIISQGPPPEAAPRREGEGPSATEETGGNAGPGDPGRSAAGADNTGIPGTTTSSGGSTTPEIRSDPEASSQMP